MKIFHLSTKKPPTHNMQHRGMEGKNENTETKGIFNCTQPKPEQNTRGNAGDGKVRKQQLKQQKNKVREGTERKISK